VSIPLALVGVKMKDFATGERDDEWNRDFSPTTTLPLLWRPGAERRGVTAGTSPIHRILIRSRCDLEDLAEAKGTATRRGAAEITRCVPNHTCREFLRPLRQWRCAVRSRYRWHPTHV